MPGTIYRTISEQIADRIRTDINSGTLEEDSVLREQELSDRFGVSRGTVRHALMQLAKEGLVVATPNIGMRVASHPTPEALDLIIDLRSRIEARVLKTVWEDLRERIGEWEAILDELKTAGEAEDLRSFFKADIHFHRFIVELYPDMHVLDLWEAVRSRMMMRYVRLEKLRDGYTEHKSLFDAVAADKKDEAERLLKANLK